MADTKTTRLPPTPPRQAVLFPAFTKDYRVAKGQLGFLDVIEGDMLLFDCYEHASKNSSSGTISQYYPLTSQMLIQSHGVPTLTPDPTGETAGTVSWRLEVPGMLMNHSCDPNCTDFPPLRGEGYAARDIRKGQALTCDYTLQYYDEGPFFEKC